MIINASGGNADAVMTVAQTLSDTQKTQARTNIGALSSASGAVAAKNLASNAVETAKIKDANVTRAKLAQDALYSPTASKSASYSIVASDLGKTIIIDSSSAVTITFNSAVASAMPTGAEIAFLRYGSGAAKIAFTGTGPYVSHAGDGQIRDNTSTTTTTIQIPERYDTIALKKVYSNSWVMTGNVQVV